MTLLNTIDQVARANIDGCTLVPTMGALHEGHMSLVQKAKSFSAPTVVSIFVNPTQFGPGEDFSRYPRTWDKDLFKLRSAGVEYVFSPSADEMYPQQFSQVLVPEVSESYEGMIRPHHFTGVSTVVCKLFNICRPQRAVFGQKDLQQCAVIRRMTQDLNFRIDLTFAGTVREFDGLAMSSRNRYLSPEDRARATLIPEVLEGARQLIMDNGQINHTLQQSRARLTEAGLEVDYLDLVNALSFTPTQSADNSSAIITAVRIGATRLIDNLLLFPTQFMS